MDRWNLLGVLTDRASDQGDESSHRSASSGSGGLLVASFSLALHCGSTWCVTRDAPSVCACSASWLLGRERIEEPAPSARRLVGDGTDDDVVSRTNGATGKCDVPPPTSEGLLPRVRCEPRLVRFQASEARSASCEAALW